MRFQLFPENRSADWFVIDLIKHLVSRRWICMRKRIMSLATIDFHGSVGSDADESYRDSAWSMYFICCRELIQTHSMESCRIIIVNRQTPRRTAIAIIYTFCVYGIEHVASIFDECSRDWFLKILHVVYMTSYH